MLTYDERWHQWHWRLQFLRDAWLCLTKQASLHKAWQSGYDDHTRTEFERRARGGK
jgi:hypothetical protein